MIAGELDFPIVYFYTSNTNDDENKIYFRSLASAGKRMRESQTYQIKWVENLINYLKNFFELPRLNLDEDDFYHGRLSGITQEVIESKADLLRNKWDLGSFPISMMVSVFEKNGIFMTRGAFNSDAIDAFSTYNPNFGHPIIHLSSNKKNYFRSRFDLAHELGHIILHTFLSEEDYNSSNHSIIERQAHHFAGAFLIPSTSYANSYNYPSLDELNRIKQRWHISIKALIMRAFDLELIEANTKQKLFINYSRRGYSSNGEPGDNLFKPEEPSYFAEGLKMLIDQNIQSIEQIKFALNLNERDIENLISVREGFLSSMYAKDDNLLKLKSSKNGATIYPINEYK